MKRTCVIRCVTALACADTAALPGYTHTPPPRGISQGSKSLLSDSLLNFCQSANTRELRPLASQMLIQQNSQSKMEILDILAAKKRESLTAVTDMDSSVGVSSLA